MHASQHPRSLRDGFCPSDSLCVTVPCKILGEKAHPVRAALLRVLPHCFAVVAITFSHSECSPSNSRASPCHQLEFDRKAALFIMLPRYLCCKSASLVVQQP